MRRFLILILLISFSKTSFGQKDEIDDFFSQFGNGFYKDLTKEKFFLVDSIINLNYLDFKQLNKTDTTLTEEDIDFISENLKNKTAQIWTNQTFDSARIKSKRKLLSIVRKTTTRTKSIAYFELSLPYFNRTKDICIFEYSFYCGRLCGESSLSLYKKINGHWIFIKQYWAIVS